MRSNRKSGKTALVVILIVIGVLILIGGLTLLTIFMRWDRIPPGWKMEDQPPGSKLEFKELNFALTVPFKPWARIKPEKLNKATTVAYIQGKKQLFFQVIAEALPGVAVDNALLTRIAQENLEAVAKQVSITNEREETLHAMRGVAFDVDAVVENQPVSYRYWVGTVNGYVYQLILLGPRGQRTLVMNEAAKMFPTFSILDYTRSAGSP